MEHRVAALAGSPLKLGFLDLLQEHGVVLNYGRWLAQDDGLGSLLLQLHDVLDPFDVSIILLGRFGQVPALLL